METRRLHNSDMKQLVQVLRTDPRSTVSPGDERFEKATQALIKKLPRRLRSSAMSWHGSLCRSHKGLDVHLINDVWSWIKYELEVAIGRFLYPIIISDALSDLHEDMARQLEPVVRMFTTEWTLAGSAPPGKHPIDMGDKWAYQENMCPACMLTRLGSDIEVLFALFACMYGRLQSRSGGHGRNGVKSIRSKRLRFIRYWMKTHPEGEQTAEMAYNFGVQMKAVRRDAKYALRRSKQSTRDTQDSHGRTPTAPHHRLDDHILAAFDISEPFNPDDRTANFKQDPKIGPVPPPSPAIPTVIEGWDLFNVTCADIHQAKNNPRGFDPLETTEEWMDKWTTSKNSTFRDDNFSPPIDDRRNTYMEKYRAPPSLDTKASRREAVLLEGDFRNGVVQFEGQVLPKPSRCSMYSAFGEEGNDGEEFEILDQTPPPSPVAEVYEEEDEEVGDEHVYQSPNPPPPAPWYENPYGDCAPVLLRLQK
ncbi:hypothetical protein SLS61_005444 [Didymella pomorum]